MIQIHKLDGVLVEIDWEQGDMIERHEYGADYAITGVDDFGNEYESQAFIFADDWEIETDNIERLGCSNEIDPDEVRADREALAELNNPYKI